MNNFTPRAQQTLALARKESDRFNHGYVGPEHFFLGLLKLGQGTAFNALRMAGANPGAGLYEALSEKMTPRVGIPCVGNIPYTPSMKSLMAMASKEARLLGHNYVGTEHLLLGMFSMPWSVDQLPVQFLLSSGLDVAALRRAIIKQTTPSIVPAKDSVSDYCRKSLEYIEGLTKQIHGLEERNSILGYALTHMMDKAGITQITDLPDSMPIRQVDINRDKLSHSTESVTFYKTTIQLKSFP